MVSKQYFCRMCAFVSALVVMTHTTYADDSSNSLEAHVHGESELTIVKEGATLEIQLASPSVNFLGFEHKASSTEDIRVVELVESALRKGDEIFIFKGCRCELLNTQVELSALKHVDEHQHANEKMHNHNEEQADNNSHSEIIAQYQYRCDTKTSLDAISVTLFENFSGIHEIHAMWVKEALQGASTLTANERTVEFR